LRGLCCTVGVKLKWLLGFLGQCVEALPDHLHVQPVTCHGNVMMRCLEVEADATASFVQKKANKQWIWIAMDATTRQVIAFQETLREEIAVWEERRNKHEVKVNWRFTMADARIRLKRLYPSIKS
jgi:chaperonin GroEL (HSP60 family)